MNISEEGKALIKKFEGCELKAYRCPVGKLTIGFGHVKGFKEGDECTKEKAEAMLDKELK